MTTPFAAPDNSLTFTPPTIPCVMFPITSYGGKGDGTTVNTTAFASAVAAAKAAGGGVVDVPSGTWATGPIHLDSNIELHLESGATIQFSANAMDYLPAVLTRWEGLDVMNYSPFVYALHATNVAITGTGTLQGPGDTWGGGVANWKSGSSSEDQRVYNLWLSMLSGISGPPTAAQVPTSAKMNGLRPTFVECNGCTNFLMEGVTAKGSPYWCIHPLYSKNVIIRNMNVDTSATSANGDGTDADSCDTCLIENMTYNTSDDMVAIKSGLNEVGIAVNRPSHNVVVRNIRATAGHGISIGSEMSGGVNNVDVTSDTMNNLTGVQYLLRIKTLAGRGGTIQNIFLENTSGAATKNAILITTSYGSSTVSPHNPALIPIVKNVSFKNVMGSGGVSLTGISGTPLDTVTFNNVNVTGSGSCTAVKNLSITMSTIGGIPSTTTMCP